MKTTFISMSLILCVIVAFGQNTHELKLMEFKVEIDNKELDSPGMIEETLSELNPKTVTVYKNNDLSYQVEFKFKRDGKRIKIRRTSQIILKDGTVVKGNRKKEVQYMSASAPGTFDFPVAENIVLDKTKYATFFISYKASVKYK